MKRAKYRGIPCYYDKFTNELETDNWIYDKLIDLNIWFDFEILQLEELPIWVEQDD